MLLFELDSFFTGKLGLIEDGNPVKRSGDKKSKKRCHQKWMSSEKTAYQTTVIPNKNADYNKIN